ncbi:MAG: NIPSNAP family protein [Planctomyces sp.]|nr:NIPSNAP family protein [Planctomyces sp.]
MSFRSVFLACACSLAVGLLAADLVRTSAEDKAPPAKQGVYELRVYKTLEGRLPALEARFRDHTMGLFEKHGMKNVMYWTPTDDEKSKNTLIYVLWHESEDAAKKSWDGFRNDPDWTAARDASEKDGKIVAGVEATYMKETEWSPKHH